MGGVLSMRGLMNLDNVCASLQFWAPIITAHIFKFTSRGSDAGYDVKVGIIDLQKWYLNKWFSVRNQHMWRSQHLSLWDHARSTPVTNKQTTLILKPSLYSISNTAGSDMEDQRNPKDTGALRWCQGLARHTCTASTQLNSPPKTLKVGWCQVCQEDMLLPVCWDPNFPPDLGDMDKSLSI